ncbi:glutamate racemase [Alkaliphilus peptidifermentans]|uniref:Glutamate racemase n=1 Tax=Alkaliphilus peptidifermentans DSM 18978 TaxID=1120976 RepID=A0A1G5I056_9FIRM|nr:glutamate racemase [Alkaliphilus peptidifermentans]SCY69334.1 glutamate racemase [Alkaliphilus peptidifermentans DSM 18978]
MKGNASLPIGVFDSGVGGISVLAQLITLMPNEGYIYYGDSLNAPYGIKETREVMEQSLKVADILVKKGIKLLVVACNTATSAAIIRLREDLDIPVIGMEPALKPAVKLNQGKKILVMATPVTLKEKKFSDLIQLFKDTTGIIKLPCPGLVEIIEKNGSTSRELEYYLLELFKNIDFKQISTIVLGCTHYVFIKDTIQHIVGKDISLIDGNYGTALHIKSIIEPKVKSLSKEIDQTTDVHLLNSNPTKDMLILSKRLLSEELQKLQHKGSINYI